MALDYGIASTPVVDIGLAGIRTEMSLPVLSGAESGQCKMQWRKILEQIFGHIDDYGKFVAREEQVHSYLKWGLGSVAFNGGTDLATQAVSLLTPFSTSCDLVLLTGSAYLYILYYSGVSKTGFTANVCTRDGTGPVQGTKVYYYWMAGGY